MEPTALRPLGRTGLAATTLALGTAPLGGFPLALDRETALDTVRSAFDEGMRLFDTAPLYGHGASERHLGEALSDIPRDDYVLETKVGRLLVSGAPAEAQTSHDGESLFKGVPADINPIFDFSRDGALRSLDASLERLRTDRVDIAHIHDPDDHLDEALAGAYPAMDELRSQGMLAGVGVGSNSSETLVYLARRADFDCFLLAGRYSLYEQGALDELFPLCLEKGIAVIAGGVFNGGLLADPSPGVTYNYAPAAPEVIARAQQLRDVCLGHGVPLRAAALQFPLGHPAVATVLTGARTSDEVKENMGLMRHPIPDDLWTELKAMGLLRADAPVPAGAPVPSALRSNATSSS